VLIWLSDPAIHNNFRTTHAHTHTHAHALISPFVPVLCSSWANTEVEREEGIKTAGDLFLNRLSSGSVVVVGGGAAALEMEKNLPQS